MSAHYDVVIVGGGIAGLSLASALAGQCSVALIEAEQTLAYHTSARSARQLIPSYGPPVVQELTVRTLDLIAAQDADRPEPVLTPRSFMLIGDDATVRAQASGHMRRITHAEALDLCPALVPDSFSAAGLDTGSFACNAPVLLEDHRRRAEAGGVDIITGARVHSAQRLGTGWELGAGQEGFQSAVVVNAAGAWADELAVLSGVEKVQLQPYRRTAAIVDVENPLPESSPFVAAADESFYFRPDGTHVLISPSESVPSGPEDAQPYPGDVERLIARLNTITTLGIRNVRTAWTGLRTEAADSVPVVGFDAEATGFFWLAGQGGYGFQTSSAIAELAAGLILAGQGPAGAAPAMPVPPAVTPTVSPSVPPARDASPASRTAEALAATRWSIRR
ncbi:NAD(P)/FAD-dependent oxidoreductase [Arthrobacter sp. 9MFCol3.1]|uniref:NAD(P)/FAD-dependent oxidoreductase n=1 Tax=Arthrobacter sp. 9MFCol3.1 TaxID=1150398 RepID=UPI00047ED82C|nr:FAD-dependent oxidoreductase [Arthrobacter sp. 9MFCol3.1]